LFTADVCDNSYRAVRASGIQFSCYLGKSVAITVGNNDAGAGGMKSAGEGGANSACGSGDNGGLSIKVHEMTL
jgi:hypothetical protein